MIWCVLYLRKEDIELNKKLLTVTLLTLLLSSCTLQDNKANNRRIDSAALVPTSQAYDGYEEYLKKDYKNFTLPEKISIVDTDNIYTLECNTQENHTNSDEITNIYQKYYNDSYDEEMLVKDSNDGLVYLAGENSSSYWGLDLTLIKSSFKTADTSENPLMGRYIADLQGEETISTGSKQYVIQSECQLINDYTNDLLKNFYNGWTFKVKDIYTELIDGKTRLNFSSCLMYENIPFQYSDSEYFIVDNDGNISYWITSQLNGVVENDEFIYIKAVVPYTVLNKTKQEKIIPFSEAVRILKDEIAENADFDFINVELMYCSLTTQPFLDRSAEANIEEADKLAREYQLQPKTFEPYWCFEIANENITNIKRYVKVNALTGELFIDVK